MIETFDDILAPMTAEAFFRDCYDRKPVLIPGAEMKFDAVMNWSILEDLLNMTAIWSSTSLNLVRDRQTIPPRAYCSENASRDGTTLLRPDPDRVMAHLRKGASLVANDIDSLTAPLRAVAGALEAAYGAKAQANLYCSWPQRQAFDSHFDTHDVFAVHVAGRKTWRVYETRMPHPIRHPRFTEIDAEQHQKNRGAVMMEAEMTPGDLLYIPRGWYHDALADTDGGTIHIAFGLTSVIGMDFLGALSDLAVNEELFRLNFPPPGAGPEALNAHVAALAKSLETVANHPGLAAAMAKFQADFRYQRGGIDLPIETEDPVYGLTGKNYKLATRDGGPVLLTDKGAVAVPATIERMLGWTIEHRDFARSEIVSAFSTLPVAEIDRYLDDMVKMGQLAPKT